MTETTTLQKFKAQLEAARADKPHKSKRPLPQIYWDRLAEDLARTEEEWDALIAASKVQRKAKA